MNEMKKLRCKKQFGVWFYKKIVPNDYNDLDAPIYELYDSKGQFAGTFGWYGEMKSAVEYGNIDEYIRCFG